MHRVFLKLETLVSSYTYVHHCVKIFWPVHTTANNFKPHRTFLLFLQETKNSQMQTNDVPIQLLSATALTDRLHRLLHNAICTVIYNISYITRLQRLFNSTHSIHIINYWLVLLDSWDSSYLTATSGQLQGISLESSTSSNIKYQILSN